MLIDEAAMTILERAVAQSINAMVGGRGFRANSVKARSYPMVIPRFALVKATVIRSSSSIKPIAFLRQSGM